MSSWGYVITAVEYVWLTLFTMYNCMALCALWRKGYVFIQTSILSASSALLLWNSQTGRSDLRFLAVKAEVQCVNKLMETILYSLIAGKLEMWAARESTVWVKISKFAFEAGGTASDRPETDTVWYVTALLHSDVTVRGHLNMNMNCCERSSLCRYGSVHWEDTSKVYLPLLQEGDRARADVHFWLGSCPPPAFCGSSLTLTWHLSSWWVTAVSTTKRGNLSELHAGASMLLLLLFKCSLHSLLPEISRAQHPSWQWVRGGLHPGPQSNTELTYREVQVGVNLTPCLSDSHLANLWIQTLVLAVRRQCKPCRPMIVPSGSNAD